MIERYTLECIEGRRKGQQYSFPGCGSVRIGRRRAADLAVPDATVSASHCTLTSDGRDVWVRDDGSTNGTMVDGERVSEARLQDGSVLTLGGRCSFRVCVQYGIDAEAEELIDSIVRTVDLYAPMVEEAGDQHVPDRAELCRCEVCGKEFPASEREEGLNICPHCIEHNEEAVMRFLMADVPAKDTEDESHALRLPGYRRLRKLGEGSFGAVWLVEEEATGKCLALKTMLESAMLKELERKKFDREMKLTSQLHHPNIVQIHAVGCEKGQYWMLQEFCAGGNLMAFLSRTHLRYAGKLPAELALHIVFQLLDALDYAYNAEVQVFDRFGTPEVVHGVVHRDIHPGNIFLADYREPVRIKLGDWGLSKAYELAGMSGVSVSDVPTGTRDFASMQQHMNFRYCGPETDVWSAAAVLFFLLTGQPPRSRGFLGFGASSESFASARPVREFRQDLSRELSQALDYTLQEQPRLRVLSAADLRDRLMHTPEGRA